MPQFAHPGRIIGPSGGGGYTAFGADFDGSNDLMLRGGDLTGNADGGQALLSCWIRVDGGDGILRRLFQNDTVRFQLRMETNNTFSIRGLSTDSTLLVDIESTSAFAASASWLHLLCSFDTDTENARHVFINDADDLKVSTFTTGTDVDFTGADWAIGARTTGSNKFNGCFSEFYFALEYLDISVEANRRKFISAAGKPVTLGPTGAAPTGSAPIVYLPQQFGSFEENAGSGGNFTVTGALALCSTSPSD